MILKTCMVEQYGDIIKTPQQHGRKHCLTCKQQQLPQAIHYNRDTFVLISW